MNDPVRLKHDARFRDAFVDEAATHPPGDTSALRQRVLNGEPPPAPPRLGAGAAAAGTTVLLLGLLFGLSVSGSPSPTTPIDAPTASALIVLDHGDQQGAERRPSAVDALSEPPTSPPIPPAVGLPAVEVTPAVAISPPPDTRTPDVEVSAPPVTPVASGLELEIADYDRAALALREERWAEARARYDAYLTTWPAGRLRDEARLNRLVALVRVGAVDEAEQEARSLLEARVLSGRRDDILVLRAQALVKLDRCDEALAALDRMRAKRRDVAREIRTTCRRR